MKYVLSILSWILDILKWVSKSDNRQVAFKYFRMSLYIAKMGAKYTKTESDDKGLLDICKKFEEVTKDIPNEEKQKLATQINEDKEGLNNLSLNVDLKSQKIKAGVGPANIEYNQKEKSAKFSVMGIDFSL